MVSNQEQPRPMPVVNGLLAVAAVAGATLFTNSAVAQDCSRLLDIAELGFIPNPNDITFGINNQHEAVGAYMVDQKKHAFLWLPAAAYNLTKGFHDLHTLADLDLDAESAAYEINDDGIAVGWTDDSGDQHAFVWQINLYDPALPLPTIDLATYSVPDDGAPKIDVARVAWAINNADPPVVVGDATGLTNCACPLEPDDLFVCTQLGFKAVLDGNDMLQELLPIVNPPFCDYTSFGRDIGALPVGYSAGTSPCVPPPPVSCDNTKDAVHFPSNVPGVLTDFSGGGSESRGVNDSSSIVGWGFENDDNPCQMSAVFWEDPAAAPFNLNSLLPVGHQSRAEAITNPDGGIMLIVGSNETTEHALRWQGSGTSWSVVDLNDKIVNQCFGTEGFTVVQAHDVSDDGWIIAWADFDPGPSIEAHAVILIPDQDCDVCCFADLDCDGTVGVKDLLDLLGFWGPCLGCPADLDCDGVVGVKDLLALLSAWGPCQPTPPTEVPKTVQDCYDKFYPQDMEALIACIEAVSG